VLPHSIINSVIRNVAFSFGPDFALTKTMRPVPATVKDIIFSEHDEDVKVALDNPQYFFNLKLLVPPTKTN
jgi:hypothetical protein